VQNRRTLPKKKINIENPTEFAENSLSGPNRRSIFSAVNAINKGIMNDSVCYR
jgi:hypothetical protein